MERSKTSFMSGIFCFAGECNQLHVEANEEQYFCIKTFTIECSFIILFVSYSFRVVMNLDVKGFFTASLF